MSWLLTVVSSELHSSDRIGRQGKKDQQPSLNSGPTLYRRVSVTRAIDSSRDPPSPIPQSPLTTGHGHTYAQQQSPHKNALLCVLVTDKQMESPTECKVACPFSSPALLQRKVPGQMVLDWVASTLGILEREYFGLLYLSEKAQMVRHT